MASIDQAWTEMTKGSKPAFLKIYQENYKQLFSYGFSLCCDKELTKDCIQNLFLEIWNGRVTLSPEVGFFITAKSPTAKAFLTVGDFEFKLRFKIRKVIISCS